MASSIASDPVDQSSLPPGLSSEEADLYVQGIAQTCAALRRRIAELEADNRRLQTVNRVAAAPCAGTVAAVAAEEVEAVEAAAPTWKGEGESKDFRRGYRAPTSSAQDMVLVSPSVVVGPIGSSPTAGQQAGGRPRGPRTRPSWMPSTHVEQTPAVLAGSDNCQPTPPWLQDESTRRVSSVSDRTRYSVGLSRFSLPCNLSPSRVDGAAEDDADDTTTQDKARGLLEGLTLTHPLTGDEKELTFMEFAEVGVGSAILSGARLLEPWGQDAEVLSVFPSGKRQSEQAGGAATGSESMVQGLEDFCFPSGVGLYLAEHGPAEAISEDRVHLVQFTDCENASTYGCCVTVSHVLQNPSARLITRLRERERRHAAARDIQRSHHQPDTAGANATTEQPTQIPGVDEEYASPSDVNVPRPMRCWSNKRNRAGGASTAPPSVPGRSGDPTGGSSQFNYQTPPPTGTGARADDSKALSRMMNRFFTASPGSEMDTGGKTPGAPRYSEKERTAVRSPKRMSFDPAIMKARATAVADRSPSGPQLSPGSLPLRSADALSPLAFTPPSTSMPRRGTGDGTNASSMPVSSLFSDDESDAGQSTDMDSGGDAESGDGHGDEVSRYTEDFVGRDGLVWQRSRTPTKRNRPAATATGVTVRHPRGSSSSRSGANVCADDRTASASPIGERAARESGERSNGCCVVAEKCYVLLSCHKNHSLMLKVLRAIANADKSTRPGSHSPSSPVRSSPIGVKAHKDGDSPLRRAGDAPSEGVAPASSTGFRTVAAAAAAEAKGRHRRMLRDKFLHHVQMDKASKEEGRKVSLHFPAFLRAPLEINPTPMELWSTAVLFASVSEDVILRALDVLLLERALVVYGKDLGMVSMTASALLSLLDPFEWEGVFVPVVPPKLMDILESPVPALVGMQSPCKHPLFDPLGRPPDGVAVLDLEANRALGKLYMSDADDKLAVPDDLVRALAQANTLHGRGRGSGTPARSLARRQDITKTRSPKDHGRPEAPAGGNTKRAAMSPVARSHFAFQASSLMSGLTPEEKSTIMRLRALIKTRVSELCGDLETRGMWRKYGAFNAATNHYEFHPEWFTEPLEARVKFHVGVARTQMFVSYVDRCRLRELERLPRGCNAPSRRPSTPPRGIPEGDRGNGTVVDDNSLASSRASTPRRRGGAALSSGVGCAEDICGDVGGTTLVTPPPLPRRDITRDRARRM